MKNDDFFLNTANKQFPSFWILWYFPLRGQFTSLTPFLPLSPPSPPLSPLSPPSLLSLQWVEADGRPPPQAGAARDFPDFLLKWWKEVFLWFSSTTL